MVTELKCGEQNHISEMKTIIKCSREKIWMKFNRECWRKGEDNQEYKEKGRKKSENKWLKWQRRLNIHITGVSNKGQIGIELMCKTIIQESIPEIRPRATLPLSIWEN